MEEITRKSHVPDAILLEHAAKVIDYLPNDLSKFTQFDLTLNQGKADSMKTAHEKILSFGTDNAEVGVVKGLTENKTDEYNKCVSLFRDVRYFAKKKFSSSPAKLKEFGVNKFTKASRTVSRLVLFMYELDNTVKKYKDDLIEAGLKEDIIASINPAAVALDKSNATQESGKSSRMVKTETRIELLNELYDILMEFSNASRRVFENDSLGRSRYVLPYNKDDDGDDGEDGDKDKGNDDKKDETQK
jgi:hypothetical protein